NSNKDPAQQPVVLQDCLTQIKEGNRSIIGFMVESNLNWGNQPIPSDLRDLKPGVSVTDACIDWSTTQSMLESAGRMLKDVLPGRVSSGKVA
ncbi:MAG: 3-deoxy-7-phosphoheptulonate synthase, partial [Pseudomonadota bacterium]|nr:3-deoxy-7-phosphoheptulonate synthase [Pseudomonadota bacterium]